MNNNAPNVDVIIGTPVCRRTSFILDTLLSNQREIQQAYPNCQLALTTDEPDYIEELQKTIDSYKLNGVAVLYETKKPSYAKKRIWSIAAGREAFRRYALSTGAEYILCIDGDLTFEPSVVSIMKTKIQGYDAAYSGYAVRREGGWGWGAGCLMIRKEMLSKASFRCYEFRSGHILAEDEILDIDLLKNHARINKGIFVSNKHYLNSKEYIPFSPRPISRARRLVNTLTIRVPLIKLSILCGYNIPMSLHTFIFLKLLKKKQEQNKKEVII
jgi:hypothetical protein